MSQPHPAPGELRNVDARAWHGGFPVGHLYTLGVAGERFFRALKEAGAITATACDRCRATYLPPRIYCPRCFTSLDRWVELEPRGTVAAFTRVGRLRDGSAVDPPRALALIRIDGAEGGLLHWVGGCDPERVRAGMRVRAVLLPRRQRRGRITDIRHFAPVEP